MRFVTVSLLVHSACSLNDDRGLPERYLYEKPICGYIPDCLGRNGCDARVFTKETGVVTVQNYTAEFNCRWEIQGPAHSSVMIKVTQGSKFGIENQKACGYDRLHIRSGDGEGFGRLCSSREDKRQSYNGMADWETIGGKKIKSRHFHDWLDLGTSHVVIGFDTDRLNDDVGFEIAYQIVTGLKAPAAEIRKALSKTLNELIGIFANKKQHMKRLQTRLESLFYKYDTRMEKCRNGAQTHADAPQLDMSVFASKDLTKIEAEWLSFYRRMFNNCDLPIIKKSGSFDGTSWPRRVARWIRQLARDVEQYR